VTEPQFLGQQLTCARLFEGGQAGLKVPCRPLERLQVAFAGRKGALSLIFVSG